MTVDVETETEIEIARPRRQVAAYGCDPGNATTWYENIKSVDLGNRTAGRRRITDRLRCALSRTADCLHLRGSVGDDRSFA